MFHRLSQLLTAPKKLKEVEEFLWEWCPKGVEVVNDGKTCWLHHGGMIYSIGYQRLPEKQHVEYMLRNLENHQWCLQLVGGIYEHRSLLESWVNKYLTDASVIGASSHDIVHSHEVKDRPLIKGTHTRFIVTHKNKFVFTTHKGISIQWLASEVREKTEVLTSKGDIYFYPN